MREILEELITRQNDGTYHARVEFIENGERGTLTSNRPTFDEATTFVQSVEAGNDVAPNDTIPEPANMTPEQAEQINGNVVPAPTPTGSEHVPNGEELGATGELQPQQQTEVTTESHEVSGQQQPTEQGSEQASDGSEQAASDK